MPTVTKPVSAYVSGNTILAAQVNANEDALFNAINGNLDQANLKNTTQIPNSMLAEIQPTIVDAHADNDGQYLGTADPGSSAAPSRPDKLSNEMERLRYRIIANNHMQVGTTIYMNDSGVANTIGWLEPQPSGPQLFLNNGFELKTAAGANAAPDNWTLVGTPTSLVITAPAVLDSGSSKRSLRVTYRATPNEGFSQTLKGLKASTKYLIGFAVARVSGSGTVLLKMSTTGALAAGNYQQLNAIAAVSGTATTYFSGIVQTTTVGADVTVSMVNTNSAADVVDFYQAWAYELRDFTNLGAPHIPMQVATDATAVTTPATFTASTWNFESRAPLALSQYIPASGYRLTYEVQLSTLSSGTGNLLHKHAFQIKLNGSVVAGPFIRDYDMDTGTPEMGGVVTLKHVVENPAPGSTQSFTVEIGAYNGGGTHSQVILNPLITTLQSVSQARLIVDRIS